MSDKKILAINPELFTFSNNTTRKKREVKPSTRIKVKSQPKAETLKKNLMLKMLRQYQENRYKTQVENTSSKSLTNTSNPNHINTELKNAQLYFDNLAEKKKNTIVPKNTTIKNYDSQPRNIPSELPLTNVASAITASGPSVMHVNKNAQVGYPKYGCLKNGNLPTFRSYMNQTRKQPELPINTDSFENVQSKSNVVSSNPTIVAGGSDIYTQNRANTINDAAINSIRQSSYQKQIYSKIENMERQSSQGKYRNRKRKKTIRRTYKIGKSKIMPKVSVLVSNKTVRNNITTKSQLLKQTSIPDIKKYLIQHGLIRVGSTTPNDVLRKIYESALTICGEVHNHNPDNILYNFINSSS